MLWIYYHNNGESNEQDKEHEMEMNMETRVIQGLCTYFGGLNSLL